MYAYSVVSLGMIPKEAFSSDHQVCNGFGGHKMSFLLHVFMFIYSFFLHSHSRARGMQLVSQHLLPQDCLIQTLMMLGILKFKLPLPLPYNSGFDTCSVKTDRQLTVSLLFSCAWHYS
jgi:hypothetical protein